MIDESLYKRTLWMNKNIDFIFGANIVEYDMKSAGLSLIKEFKLLPSDEITMLDKMDKKARNIKIGLYQKNKDFAKKLLECFVEARKRFLLGNNLTEDKIISIKKDAIFTIDTRCEVLQYGFIVYDSKNRYTSYVKMNKLEFYINTLTNVIDIKGLGQGDELANIHELHDNFILDFIMKFSRMRENNVDKKAMVTFLSRFVGKYRNKELDIGYYRELSRENTYKIYDSEMEEFINVSDTNIVEDVDISYNYFNYILPLVSIYL